MEKEELINIIERLNMSPIRKELKVVKDTHITLFEEERMILEKIDDILNTSMNSFMNPIKVVVLGEIKAGKSTFINSLIKNEISYTNVLEATSAIIEIKYSDLDRITIHYKDNTKENINNLNELNNIIDKNRNNQIFFENIIKIGVNTNISTIKGITIVDTPGLHTLTQENSNRTNSYIKNSDVILWVINANNLGQSDIIEKIEEILEFNKPIIGIINRVDEVDASEDEIKEYVELEMGYLFKEVFTTSAIQAWNGYLEEDIDKIEKSNINSIYEYIENNIEKKSIDVKIDSIKSTIIAQIRQDIYVHLRCESRLKSMLSKIEGDLNEIKSFNKAIKQDIEHRLEKWIDRKLFREEIKSLESCKIKEYESKRAEYINKEYIGKLIADEYYLLGEVIKSKWNDYNENYINQIENRESMNLNINSLTDTNDIYLEDGLLDGATKGGMVAGVAGLGLAGYAAWIGPAASYVTIGGAIGSIIPPLLIAGAIGGVAINCINNIKNKEKKLQDIESIYSEIKDMAEECILNKMQVYLNKYSDTCDMNSQNILYNILNQCNTSKGEIESIDKELEFYIEYIKGLLKQYE